MTTTPVEIDGAIVAFDPLILKGDPGGSGSPGPVGATGATTNLTMGTITTVPDGQAASASLTGTAPNQVLNLVLPAGPVGPLDGSGTYIAPLLALDTDGVYFPAQPAGLYQDLDGAFYYSPGYPATHKVVLDTDGVPYPVAIGA